MSSGKNDLTQSLLAECRRKDASIETYKQKIDLLEKLIQVKEERIKIAEEEIKILKNMVVS